MNEHAEFHALVASTTGHYYATLGTYRSREAFYRREHGPGAADLAQWELIDLFPSYGDALNAADDLNEIAGFTDYGKGTR